MRQRPFSLPNLLLLALYFMIHSFNTTPPQSCLGTYWLQYQRLLFQIQITVGICSQQNRNVQHKCFTTYIILQMSTIINDFSMYNYFSLECYYTAFVLPYNFLSYMLKIYPDFTNVRNYYYVHVLQ